MTTSATPVESLASALSARDVSCDRTTPDELAETLAAHLREPAVGVALDGVAAALSGTDVTVDQGGRHRAPPRADRRTPGTRRGNGGTLYVADDGADANEHVQSVVDERDAERVVKSESMTAEEIAYHSHCRQRTLGLEPHTVAVLEERGYDVLTSAVGCRGLAGSFGCKEEYHDVSVAVGDELREQFAGDDARDRIVVASGPSCLDQLNDLLERPTTRPRQLLSPW